MGVVGIGKIIKNHGTKINHVPVIRFWMGYLPLKFLKEEGMAQN
jgi:hypothetical protein